MINEVANIKINGQPQDDLIPDVVEIEAEEDLAQAAVFRVRLALRLGSDGSWDYLDGDRFTVWNRLSLDAGFPDDTQTLIDGYITHVDASLSNDEHQAYLELSGMDASCLMDLQDRQLAWANKKDHEIAQQIFQSYGLDYEVEDTVARHEESAATILQTDPDFRFLRRLAARNGFECFVSGAKGFFRSPNLREPPQKLLAIQFGQETNLSSLKIKVDGTPPAQAEIRRIDPLEKSAGVETLSATPLRRLGARPLSALQAATPGSRVLLKEQLSAYADEMRGRLRNAYRGADRFLRAEGEIDGRAYQAVLRANKLVTIKGAGANYSGLYYVTRVTHSLNAETYTQRFEACRNGIGLTGEEDFGSASLLPASLPGVGAGAQGPDSGSRVLPPQSGSPGGI